MAQGRLRWSDYSLDYKLFFLLFIVVMGTFALDGISLTLVQAPLQYWPLVILAPATLICLGIALHHRARREWHSPPVTWREGGLAIGGATVAAIFAIATTSMFRSPPVSWLFGVGLIGSWNVLHALKIVHQSDASFERDCGPTATPLVEASPQPIEQLREPGWPRFIRTIYSFAFFAVWLSGMGFFYLKGRAMRLGAKTIDATHTWPVTDHGNTVYVTHSDGVLVKYLESGFTIGVPVMLLTGFLLQYVFKLTVFGKIGEGDAR